MEKQLICFELGYKVEDLTEFRDRLVDIFGIGGTVTHDRSGAVTKFNVLLKYGTLGLDLNREVLELDMSGSDFGRVLSSETIQDLYRKLRDKEIITGSKPWYLEKRMVCEI